MEENDDTTIEADLDALLEKLNFIGDKMNNILKNLEACNKTLEESNERHKNKVENSVKKDGV